MSHVYCPECGFQNMESAHFCARCGAMLVTEGEPDGPTLTFSATEIEEEHEELDELGIEGPALVVRSGGGRTGEQFPLEKAQTTIRPATSSSTTSRSPGGTLRSHRPNPAGSWRISAA